MLKLVQGIHSFQRFIHHRRLEMFQRLTQGQKPLALFITCSDSRIDPNLLTQTDPGELFTLRTAGNIVPAYESVSGGEAASIEYAVSVLKVRDVILCGHSSCGAMAALLDIAQLQNLPAVAALLKHAEATRQAMQQFNHLADEGERLLKAVEQNVLVQIENLKTHPTVTEALARDRLAIHGWVYRLETGDVTAYDPGQQAFVPLSAYAQTHLVVHEVSTMTV